MKTMAEIQAEQKHPVIASSFSDENDNIIDLRNGEKFAGASSDNTVFILSKDAVFAGKGIIIQEGKDFFVDQDGNVEVNKQYLRSFKDSTEKALYENALNRLATNIVDYSKISSTPKKEKIEVESTSGAISLMNQTLSDMLDPYA